jgi:acetyl-CoA acetyltransferase
LVGGVAESALGEVWDQNELEMAASASLSAVGQSGVNPAEIDTVYALGLGDAGPLKLARILGCQPQRVGATDVGGASFGMYVDEAKIAIEEGRSNVVLIAYASRQRTRRARRMQFGRDDPVGDISALMAPVGLPSPIGDHALLASRYLHRYKANLDDFGAVAVAARQWATLNEKAWSREPLSLEDTRESPIVSTPLRKVDCCLVTDGGGAILVVSEAVAVASDLPAVEVIGTGTALGGWSITRAWDDDQRGGAVAARLALSAAGIRPDEIDVLEPYDNFTVSVLMQLEDLGLCGPGEAPDFVRSVGLGPGGGLPSMTSGGGLSYCHPGKLGLLLLIEGVRQMRDSTGTRQAGTPRLCVVHAVGGTSSAIASTVVLGRP